MESKSDSNSVRIIECNSFDDFTAKLRAPHWGVQCIFRGQRDVNWPLSSLWDRLLKFHRDGYHPPDCKPYWGEHEGRNLDELFGPQGRINRNRFRDASLKAFRESASGLPGIRGEDLRDDRKTWALGRHHGLVTPLLDWTYSPYIAILFACFDYAEFHNPGLKAGLRGAVNFMGSENKPAQPIAVWELALPADIEVADEFELIPWSLDQSYRQKAQRGLFTFLNHPTHIDVVRYLAGRNLARYLARYEMPGTEVGRALWNLSLMNITYGTLFPDLEGAAVEANILHAFANLKHQYPLQENILSSDGSEDKNQKGHAKNDQIKRGAS